MKHFVGLDVSVKETSICVVDGDGDVVLQTSVPSEPRAIVDRRLDRRRPGEQFGQVDPETGAPQQIACPTLR